MINSIFSAELATHTDFHNEEAEMILERTEVRVENPEDAIKLMLAAFALGLDFVIFTPRVDRAGRKYIWIGLRKGNKELDYKLLLNAEVEQYLKCWLTGKELPTITDFEPADAISDQEEWLAVHREEYLKHAESRTEVLSISSDGKNYLTEKLIFPKGKIVYPSTVIGNVLDLLSA